MNLPLFRTETLMDSADQAFVQRELESVSAKTYDKKYPNLKLRSLVPVNRSHPSGAETIKYDQYDMVGVAKVIKNYADDLPRADVKKVEFRATVKGLGNSYGYSLQEMRTSALTGVGLDQKKGNAARRSMEEAVDRIGSVGDSANGLLGLLNQTNALAYTIPNGAYGDTEWSGKTGLEILADLTNTVNKIVTTTHEIEAPDTLLLPTDQFALISSMPLQAGSDTTILKHFLNVNPYIKNVESWYKLVGAGSAGADRMVAYARDSDHVELIIPQEFEILPAQQRNLEWINNCHMRCAGVIAYYPLSICYADGI